MIERVNVYVAALCGPKFVGGHGAWAYSIFHEAWDDQRQIFLPEKMVYTASRYLPPKPDQTAVILSYKGIIEAMEWMIEAKLTSHHVRVYGHEVRSISQLSRRWKPKGDNIPMWKKADYVRYQFQDIYFTWVGEEKIGSYQVAKMELQEHGVDPSTFPKNVKAEMTA